MTCEEEKEEIERFRRKLESLGLLETFFPEKVSINETRLHRIFLEKDPCSGELVPRSKAFIKKQTVYLERHR